MISYSAFCYVVKLELTTLSIRSPAESDRSPLPYVNVCRVLVFRSFNVFPVCYSLGAGARQSGVIWVGSKSVRVRIAL